MSDPTAAAVTAAQTRAQRAAVARAISALRLTPVLFERLDWRPYGIRPVLPIAATPYSLGGYTWNVPASSDQPDDKRSGGRRGRGGRGGDHLDLERAAGSDMKLWAESLQILSQSLGKFSRGPCAPPRTALNRSAIGST